MGASGHIIRLGILNPSTSKQPLTLGCLKQQNIPTLGVPLMIDFERCTLKEKKSFCTPKISCRMNQIQLLSPNETPSVFDMILFIRNLQLRVPFVIQNERLLEQLEGMNLQTLGLTFYLRQLINPGIKSKQSLSTDI